SQNRHDQAGGQGFPLIQTTNVIGSTAAVTSRRVSRDVHRGDQIFRMLLRGASLVLVAMLTLIAVYLGRGAWPAIERFGLSFLTTSVWDPVAGVFGAAPVIFGTLVSSLLAMSFATPLAIGVALFLNELAAPKVAAAIGFGVEMLAAIPSVIFGL